MNENVVFFWDGPFSQWYQSDFIYRGIKFCTAEQFMMYHKAMFMGDEKTAELVLKSASPKIQKALGRSVENFSPKLWDKVKRDVVYMGNWLKFTQNDDLKKMLLDTGDKLIVEASPYDLIWGIGLSAGEAKNTPQEDWLGQNLLGLAIMEVRTDLKTLIK